MSTIMGNGVTIRGGSRANKGVALNIDYGSTPPSDTSKLWIPNNGKEPNTIEINDKFMAFGDEVIDSTYSNSMPSKRHNTTAIAIGTKIYIIGGTEFTNGSSTITNKYHDILIFDTISNSFSSANVTLNYNDTYGTPFNICATAYGTKIYIFGWGYTNNSFNKIQEYDTITNTVTVKTATCNPNANGATAITYKDYIYIFGGLGNSSTSYYNTIWRYDPINDIFTQISSPSPTLSSNSVKSGLIAANDKIYIVGTSSYSSLIMTGNTTIQEYDVAANTCVKSATTLQKAYGSFGSAAVGNKLYLFGGQSYSTSYGSVGTNIIQVFDTGTMTTQVLNSVLPVDELCNMSCAAVGDYIYLFGGQPILSGTSKHGSVSSVYRFNVQTLLEVDTMKMFTDMYSKDHALINSAKVKLYSTIKNAYIGNSEGYAKLVPVYVYDSETSKWKTIEDIDYTG